MRWLSTTPLWPQANGLVERTNRTVLKVLKIATLEKANIQREFRKFLVAYRSTPHSGTGCTPFSLMFGREMRTKLPQLDYSASDPEVARDRDMEYKIKYKDYADKKAADSEIKEGDTVVMRNERQGKLEPNFKPEKYKVVGMSGSDIVCTDSSGETVRRNVQFAKKLKVQVDSCGGVDGESAFERQGQDSDKSVDDSPSANTHEPTVRTSGRVRHPPARLNDYIVYR